MYTTNLGYFFSTPIRGIIPGLRKSLAQLLSRKYGLWVPLFYLLVLLLLAPRHKYFTDWGGVMQYFAGKEILSGIGYHGWTSGFWPPLFSVLIGLGSMILPGFAAGKLISIISSVLLLYVSYDLAMTLSDKVVVGLWTQVFLAVCPLYFDQSLVAHNHMLNAFFFITGISIFLKCLQNPTAKKSFFAGCICGLACLSRYTSYVLLALPVSLLIIMNIKEAAKLAGIFWAAFILVSLPWWYYNTINNGSPLSSWEYLNVCTAIPGNAYGELRTLWWCGTQAGFKGFFGIVSAYPLQYVENFVRNVIEGVKYLVTLSGSLIPFTIPALFEGFFLLKTRYWLTLYGELFLSIAMISLAGVNDYYLLGMVVLVIVISVLFIVEYVARIQQRYQILKKYRFQFLLFAVLMVGGFVLAGYKFPFTQKNPYFHGGLAEMEQVTDALKSHDANIGAKVIMAVDPARAYYAGSKYLMTPLEYDGSVEDMVSYGGLNNQARAFAPKYPSNMDLGNLRADYLIYTRTPSDLPPWQPHDLPQYSFLLDPGSDKIPNNFKLVYRSTDVAIYEILWK